MLLVFRDHVFFWINDNAAGHLKTYGLNQIHLRILLWRWIEFLHFLDLWVLYQIIMNRFRQMNIRPHIIIFKLFPITAHIVIHYLLWFHLFIILSSRTSLYALPNYLFPSLFPGIPQELYLWVHCLLHRNDALIAVYWLQVNSRGLTHQFYLTLGNLMLDLLGLKALKVIRNSRTRLPIIMNNYHLTCITTSSIVRSNLMIIVCRQCITWSELVAVRACWVVVCHFNETWFHMLVLYYLYLINLNFNIKRIYHKLVYMIENRYTSAIIYHNIDAYV